MLSVLGLIGDSYTSVTSIAIAIGDSIYGMDSAGRIDAYKAVKKQIKVNKVTGAESVVGEWWLATFKLYDNAGTLYQTFNYSYRAK